MNARDIFQNMKSSRDRLLHFRKKRTGFLPLRATLTLLIGAELIVSILISFGIVNLVHFFFPAVEEFPLIIQIYLISTVMVIVGTVFLSRLFFDPIKKLCAAMQKVADGDYSVRVQTRFTAKEIQEMFAGFNLMAQELQNTEILQSDFVSNVSHEIKTPIAAIEGYATLLQGEDSLTDSGKVYTDKILYNTGRLSSLVGNILKLSKLENQSIPTPQERYDLAEQIRLCIVSLEPLWEQRQTEFDVELQEFSFLGSRELLSHVWSNLIANAIKFGPVGGTVKVRLCRQENGICFTVEDEGPGLTEAQKKRIFDKFYQGDRSHKQEGNGLGLTLAKRIVTLSGGSITAQNRAQGGCIFTITLPVDGES